MEKRKNEGSRSQGYESRFWVLAPGGRAFSKLTRRMGVNFLKEYEQKKKLGRESYYGKSTLQPATPPEYRKRFVRARPCNFRVLCSTRRSGLATSCAALGDKRSVGIRSWPNTKKKTNCDDEGGVDLKDKTSLLENLSLRFSGKFLDRFSLENFHFFYGHEERPPGRFKE